MPNRPTLPANWVTLPQARNFEWKTELMVDCKTCELAWAPYLAAERLDHADAWGSFPHA